MEKLTPVAKLLIAGVLVVCGVVGYRTHKHRFVPVAPEHSAAPASSASKPAAPAQSRAARPFRIAVSQWPGHMPLLVAAGGLETQPDSPAAREGLKFEVVFIWCSAVCRRNA